MALPCQYYGDMDWSGHFEAGGAEAPDAHVASIV